MVRKKSVDLNSSANKKAKNSMVLKLPIVISLIFGALCFILPIIFGLLSIGAAVISAVLFVVFYLFKGVAFSKFIKNKEIGYLKGMEIFFISDAVEAVSFTGKIGSDASKIILIRKILGLKSSVTKTISFRIITIITTLFALLILVNVFLGLGLAVITISILFFINPKYFDCFLFNFASELARICLIVIILFEFHVSVTAFILFAIILGQAIGRLIAPLPHGLGVQEAAIGGALFGAVSAIGIAEIIIILRLVTVVPSIIIGIGLGYKHILGLAKHIQNIRRKLP
jgi:hypothetical protein